MFTQNWRRAGSMLAMLGLIAVVPVYADGVHVAPAGNATSLEGIHPVDVAPIDPAPLPPCAGDITGDGRVDLMDVALVLGEYGWIGVLPLEADADHDGVVGLTDLAIVMNAYGATCDN